MKYITIKNILSVLALIIFIFIILSFFLKDPTQISNEIYQNQKKPQDILKYIDKKKLWKSNKAYQQDTYAELPFITFLNFFFQEYKIKSIVDFGCDNWQYMRYVKIPSNVAYIGVDNSKINIAENIKLFGRANVEFKFIESYTQLSNMKADLLIIKDVLNDWSNKDINDFIKFTSEHYKYIIFVHPLEDPITRNSDIRTGNYRGLDLTKQPFNVESLMPIFHYIDNISNDKKERMIALYKNDGIILKNEYMMADTSKSEFD